MDLCKLPTLPERTAEPPVGPGVFQGSSLALDQWRGLALLLVLISHGFYFTGAVHGIGRVGVNLFFFISGVLVFRSLNKPREVPPLSLATHFWKRRLKRLYPALVAYLLAMFPIAWLLERPSLPPFSDFASFAHAVPYALIYTINYWPEGPLSIAHLWSVSCEMQFYLFAPSIFLVGIAFGKRSHWVWYLLLAVLLTTGVVGYILNPLAKYRPHQTVWPMMLGFCCEHRKQWFMKIPSCWVTFILRSSLIICTATLVLMLFGQQMKFFVIATGALVLAPCFLAYVNGRDMPGATGSAMAWLGVRTYSIYLWQQPLTICGYLPNAWHPLGALASSGVGGLWFRWFERPFLSRKR